MGQAVDVDEKQQLEDVKTLNTSLKDYLFIGAKKLDWKSIINKRKRQKLILERERWRQENLMHLSLMLTTMMKDTSSQNCNFNSALLSNRISDSLRNQDEEDTVAKQLELISKLSKGKNLRNIKTDTSEKRSDKFSSHQSFNENEIVEQKVKSDFTTLNNSLINQQQVGSNNNTTKRKKNLQNLEISKINTTKTANQTNIIDEDFGFEDYLKSDTTRVKPKQKVDVTSVSNEVFKSTINSKKKETISVKSSQREHNVDFSDFQQENSRAKEESYQSKKPNSNMNKSNAKFGSKITYFDGSNSRSNNRVSRHHDGSTSKPKYGNNSNNLHNTSNTPSKNIRNPKQVRAEKKPVVNIKIDLRDIVKEDIIDSYMQNTHSISNSNIKTSLSPAHRSNNIKPPFTSKKKPTVTTPSKVNNFKQFVENCSNPNKNKNFYIDNAKKKQIVTATTPTKNIKKQHTIANLNKSRDVSSSKKEQLTKNKTVASVQKSSQTKSNDNYAKQTNNLSNYYTNTPTTKQSNQTSNKAKKVVCLDISDEGEIIDTTDKNQSNEYMFTPSENKVKYSFKPRVKQQVYSNTEMNDSFGQGSASFN